MRPALRLLASIGSPGLLAACPIAAFEVPLETADLAPAQVEHLLVGQSRRDDVRSALGEPQILIADGFEIHQTPTGRLSANIVLLFPFPFSVVAPVPMPGRQLHEGELRVLASYDEAGVLQALAWEHAHFAQSPLRALGSLEPAGPLVADAYGTGSTAVAIAPSEMPGPRLIWEGDTIVAAAPGAFAILGERAGGTLALRNTLSGAVLAAAKPPVEICGQPPHTGRLLSGEREILVISDGGELCLWEVTTGSFRTASPAGSAERYRARPAQLAVAGAAGSIATIAVDSDVVTLWNPLTGEVGLMLPVPGIAAIAASDRAEVLIFAAGTPDRLVAVSPASGEVLGQATLPGPRRHNAAGLAVAPEGQMIAVNRRAHVEVWRLGDPSADTGSEGGLQLENVLLLPISSNLQCPPPVAFSGYGRHLAAGCDSAVVWETAGWREIFRLVPDEEGEIGGFPAWIDEGFALAAGGRHLVTTHGVWDVPDAAASGPGS